MKTLFVTATLAGVLSAGGNLLAAESAVDLSLEPCMNGAVSASGLYPTQAAEDVAFAELERHLSADARGSAQ